MAYVELQDTSEVPASLVDAKRVAVFTAAATLTILDEVAVGDVDGGSFTLTLPASPSDGQVQVVLALNAVGGSKEVTADGNGKNISTGTASASTAGPITNGTTFIFSTTADDWLILD